MQKRSSENQSAIINSKLDRGLTNGNGFTNGFGGSKNPRETINRSTDLSSRPELSTYANGLTNGNGLSASDGETNGNGLINGNGFSNGNGKPNRIPIVKAKRLKKRIIGLAVAVFMILAPLSIYLIEIPEAEENIVINGDFRDWDGFMRHTDSLADASQHPNVNIVETSIVVEGDRANVLLVVDGWIFKGGSDFSTDQVHILLDSDADSSTGYLYDGMGADYMIHAHGRDARIASSMVYMFDTNFKSSEPRSQNDWAGWNPANNGKVACSSNKLEANVFLFKDTYNPDKKMYAIFETIDYAGFSDRTELVSTEKGYLVVDQTPAVDGDVIDSRAGVSSLRLVATAHESSMTIDSFSFYNNVDAGLTMSPQLPVTLREGESIEIIVNADTSGIGGKSVLKLELDSASAHAVLDSKPMEIPVTITGKGYSGYVESVPERIIIDGAFGDWARVEGHSDDIAEGTTAGNSNIDIREYRTVESTESISFYVRVDGTMMEGSKILHRPLNSLEDRIINKDDDGQIVRPFNIEIPPKYGYDYAYFMLDTDINPATGYDVGAKIGADYLVRIVGQKDNIQTRELFKYQKDYSKPAVSSEIGIIEPTYLSYNWVKVNEVEAGSDSKRLETQVTADMFNLEVLGEIDYFIFMTDWSRNIDSAEDPFMGSQGMSGTIYVQKMDENTVHLEPKEPNSRNPMNTRASMRATIAPGDQGGADITPLDGDTLAGNYWNIDRFELIAGRTIYLQTGTITQIKAGHIYINGTIIGNQGNGSAGGTAGAALGFNGGNGVGTGGGSGGTGSATLGGDGGGGGAYGGDGGDGGDSGSSAVAGGGAGGTAFDSANTLTLFMGSGGGGGGGGDSAGGAGGAGGGAIWLQAIDNIGIAGEITVNGSNGANGANDANDAGGGGGGGSGGGILIKLDSSTNALVISGKLYASGGAGGTGGTGGGAGPRDGGGGGGGGGGGRIKIFYNSSFTNTSIMMNASGALGSGGGGSNPGNGGTAGAQGTTWDGTIPEFATIAVPISLTLIVFYGMRRRNRGSRKRSDVETAVEVVA